MTLPFKVVFPSSWSGIRTGLWCNWRNIGEHNILCNLDGSFTAIIVFTFGKFQPRPIYRLAVQRPECPELAVRLIEVIQQAHADNWISEQERFVAFNCVPSLQTYRHVGYVNSIADTDIQDADGSIVGKVRRGDSFVSGQTD